MNCLLKVMTQLSGVQAKPGQNLTFVPLEPFKGALVLCIVVLLRSPAAFELQIID